MADIDEAKILMRPAYQAAKAAVDGLEDIVARNQNAGCGGDRQLSEREWNILKDCAGHLRLFKELAECLGGPREPAQFMSIRDYDPDDLFSEKNSDLFDP